MRDFLYVSFFLGHESGEAARALLRKCALLEHAERRKENRHSWLEDIHLGVSVRLPTSDERLAVLLQELQELGVEPWTRLDREYSPAELDAAPLLILRVATAGLLGGVDYGQEYDYSGACGTCGAGALPIPPLMADLGKMGKKDVDQLIYEGHLVVSHRTVAALDGLHGFTASPVRTPRGVPDARFAWLRITSELPPMDETSEGIVTYKPCPTCSRSGHYGAVRVGEVPKYRAMPKSARDVNLTWEYFGDWQQVRYLSHTRPIGGQRQIVVSQAVRRRLLAINVRRLVWVPVTVLE
jgi:hypothetical protein